MQTPCSQQRQQPPTRLRVRMAMAPAALRPAHPWHQDAPKLVQRRFRATPAAAGAAGGEPRDAAGRQPAPTRLQQQLEQLVALDVECAHFKVPGQPRVVHLPAEVCVVDAHGEVLLHTHCNPRTDENATWQFVGGVPVSKWSGAPPLEDVRQQVAGLLEGRVLVGHNLPQDLATLGLSHPRELCRDTMRFRQLQSERGVGQRLQALSEAKLGRRIQQAGERHDPREDALAALDLYIQHVHLDPSGMEYEDLVEHHLAEILAAAAAAAAAAASPEDEGE